MTATIKRGPPIGMTVIGGFLGAGKTTLVNHILRNAPDQRIGVLVNDFGAINIDAELIEQQEGDTIRLANGCICCGLGDDLPRALIGVLAQETRPAHLLIEASGVAEPWRIAELARAAPEFSPPRILVLADAAAIEKHLTDRYVGDLAMSQIDSADLLILNKTDLLDDQALNQVRNRLAARRPGLPIIESRHAMIDCSELGLGISASRRAHAAQVAARDAAQTFRASRFLTRDRFDRVHLEAAMTRLPPGLLRLKGIIYLTGETTPQVLQASSGQWSLTPWRRHPPAAKESRIVAIGVRGVFDPETLTAVFGAETALP